MSAVLLVIHLILALAIIGLVLLQRSEGGGLGMGSSGGGMGSFATPQATANALTRATWICVALFFTTSLGLGIMAGHSTSKTSIIDQLDAAPAAVTAPAEAGKDAATETPAKKADPKVKSEPSVPTSE